MFMSLILEPILTLPLWSYRSTMSCLWTVLGVICEAAHGTIHHSSKLFRNISNLSSKLDVKERERERMTTCQSKAHLARALFACYFRAVMLIRDPCVEMLRLLGQAAPPNKVLLESER